MTKLTLSPYGKKEIGRRIINGATTITRGNFNINLRALLKEDQEALGLLRGTKGDQCIWTQIEQEEPKEKEKRASKKPEKE